MKDFEFLFKMELPHCIKMVELIGRKWSEACAQLRKLLFWQMSYIPEELVVMALVFLRLHFL